MKLFVSAALFLVILSSLALAHGVGGYEQSIDGYDVHVQPEPFPVIAGEPVTFEIELIDPDGNPYDTNVQAEVLRVREDAARTGPGVYAYATAYERFGANEIAIIFDDKVVPFEIEVELPEEAALGGIYWLAGAVLVALLFGAGVATKKLKWTSALLYGGILLIIIGLGYSVFAFQNSPAVQGCTLQVGDMYVIHCHQNVHVSICGNEQGFGWEKGTLNSGHTHKGDFRVHWHPGEAIADPGALQTLQNLFSDVGLELTQSSIQGPQDSQIYTAGEDSCGTGSDGTLSVFITEEDSTERVRVEDFLTHPLPDESRVDIVYE